MNTNFIFLFLISLSEWSFLDIAVLVEWKAPWTLKHWAKWKSQRYTETFRRKL